MRRSKELLRVIGRKFVESEEDNREIIYTSEDGRKRFVFFEGSEDDGRKFNHLSFEQCVDTNKWASVIDIVECIDETNGRISYTAQVMATEDEDWTSGPIFLFDPSESNGTAREEFNDWWFFENGREPDGITAQEVERNLYTRSLVPNGLNVEATLNKLVNNVIAGRFEKPVLVPA